MGDHILDNVYLGDVMDAAEIDELKARGVTHIVNLSQGDNLYAEEFTYLRYFIRDFDSAPIEELFDPISQFIEEAIGNGGSVLVHCQAGISRSATVVMAWLMKHRNMPLDQAMQHTKQRRPIIGPNEGFMAKLVELHGQLYPGKPHNVFLRDGGGMSDVDRLMTRFMFWCENPGVKGDHPAGTATAGEQDSSQGSERKAVFDGHAIVAEALVQCHGAAADDGSTANLNMASLPFSIPASAVSDDGGSYPKERVPSVLYQAVVFVFERAYGEHRAVAVDHLAKLLAQQPTIPREAVVSAVRHMMQPTIFADLFLDVPMLDSVCALFFQKLVERGGIDADQLRTVLMEARKQEATQESGDAKHASFIASALETLDAPLSSASHNS